MKAFMPPTKKRWGFISSTIGFILIMVFWLLLSYVQNNQIVFPSLGSTLVTLGNLFRTPNTYLIMLNSIGGVVLVLLIGFFIALALVLLSLKIPYFKNFITPFLALCKIVPVPALIILFLANFKQGFIPYLLAFLIVLPLVYDGIYGAFISINQDVIDEIHLLSKLNMKIIFKVYLPMISKALITTLLQAFGLGLKIKIMSEFVAEAPNTIGYALSYGRATLSMDIVFAWSLVLIILVVVIDYWLINVLKRQD